MTTSRNNTSPPRGNDTTAPRRDNTSAPRRDDGVLVVGAGFSGLAAALHLRASGHEVTVLDVADAPGGRAGTVTADGYRFDTGPTVVTMVDLIDELFALVGERREDHCELVPLDPIYNATFADGSALHVTADAAAMTAAIEDFASPKDADGYRRFVDWTSTLFSTEWNRFINADVRNVTDLAHHWRSLAELVRLGGFGSWYARTQDFFTDERLRRVFSFQAMYAGLSPLEALGLMAVIAHMDSVQGVYAPIGGVQAIASALAAVATAAGVKIRYNSEVTAITSDDREVKLTIGDGETVRASAAVVTVDLPLAYRDLLKSRPPALARRATPSPSCLVWHLKGAGDLPAGAAHHNVHFGHDWDDAFDELFAQRQPMSDPSRFVTIGSLSDPTAAPEAHHALYVLEPVPNLTGDVDWASVTPALTERMLGAIDQIGYELAEPTPVTVIDPVVWRHRRAAWGTPLSFDHRFTQSGPFRPANYDRRFPRVVFAGSGTRPGLGLPMVLISGRLAAARVQELMGS